MIAISALGLAMGLACLAAALVRDHLQADAGVLASSGVVTFERRARGSEGNAVAEWSGFVPASALREALQAEGAPMAASARVDSVNWALRGTGRAVRMRAMLADPELTSLFMLPVRAGDLSAVLTRPDGVALTEAAAEQLFGAEGSPGDWLGRQVRLAGPEAAGTPTTWTVAAVLGPVPAQAMLREFDAIFGFDSAPVRARGQKLGGWWFAGSALYARLLPQAHAEQLGAWAQRAADQHRQLNSPGDDYRAMSLDEWGLRGDGSTLRWRQMLSLGLAALVTLLLAAVHVVNLGSVSLLRRQREIALRKTLGAGPGALWLMLCGEALVVAMAASLLGLLLAWWVTPLAEALLPHRFDHPVLSPASVVASLAGGALLALLTGAPLAWLALRVPCAAALAGRAHDEGRGARGLRRALTAVQFGAAAGLATVALTVAAQGWLAGERELGYQLQGRWGLDLPDGELAGLLSGAEQTVAPGPDLLLASLARLPGVVRVTSSSDLPGRNQLGFSGEFQRPGGRVVAMRIASRIGPGFFETYGVPLLAGRLSADHRVEAQSGAVVLDRSAVAALGFASPEAAIGQVLQSALRQGSPAKTVAAVVPDLRLESAREPHVPTLFDLTALRQAALTLWTRDAAATRQALPAWVAQWVPEETVVASPVAEQLAVQYRDDRRMAGLIAVAGLVALLMAGVGLYAMAAHTLRMKQREIVLRKLHGAGRRDVALLLLREFAGAAAAGVVVGLPLAWWAGEWYLSQFAVRVPLGAWPMLLACLILTLVAGLAVTRHLLAAFRLRPAQALAIEPA
ncbi:ABC transporter permease [Ideonella azotifigens]|uniref:FtsX-like permease family protein n=4 Tax=Ideonella azotifigens TaxID=513160 RepID=A0ABN1KLA3_9BURK|nr:ABC transporter permease [Ideonella azotifigens]